IACNVRAVSLSDSPFATLDPPALKLITSAESRLAASSNEILVRVEFSRKKFTTVRPRRAGTFLITRVPTSRNDSAVSRIRVTSVALRSCIDNRCSFTSPCSLHDDRVLTVELRHEHADVVREAARQIVPAVRDADEDQICSALVSLQDLVSDPGERPPDVVGLHDLGAQKGTPLRASREADGLSRIFDSLPGLAGPA